MKPTTAEVVYYLILIAGYGWAAVQLFAGEPFDAAILFLVTFYLQGYRNGVRQAVQDV